MSNDAQNNKHVLKQLPLLHGLQSYEYDILLEICKVRAFADGEVLFQEGQPSRSFFTLLSGQIQLITEKKIAVHTVNPGEIFGEIGVIGDIHRTASAVANQAGRALEIDGSEFKFLLGKAPRVSSIILRNITVNLASHIVRMNNAKSAEYMPAFQDLIPHSRQRA